MLPEQNQNNQTMLDANQLATLQQTINGFSAMQLAWASGYLAAKSEQGSDQVAPTAIALVSSAAPTLTVLYASQTGNAKSVATKLADAAKAQGITVNLKNVADYKVKALKTESHVLIVSSTNGEGEPPDDALVFHEFLLSKKAPELVNLHYAVLALGDSSYEFFCQTGKDFDQRLQALGAKPILARVDCDVDYQTEAQTWIATIVAELKPTLLQSQTVTLAPASQAQVSVESQYSKEHPFVAELLVSQKITGRDSAKDVRHVEISLSESGLQYQPGDALGVWFENDVVLVEELLDVLDFTGDETIVLAGESYSLRDALIHQLEITQTAPKFIKFWAEHTGDAGLLNVADDNNALRLYAAEHQIVDVIRKAPLNKAERIAPQTLVDELREITPRLYSIASSQAEVEDEVHLTVGVVSYQENGQQRLGGASSFLTQRLTEGSAVKVFIEHNNNFRLPANDDTPVIMIGPGTGVAPFRAFMQEREARGAQGKNWMLFGDQTFTQDFLYQVEWQNYLKSGLLTRMDVAFSRDQAQKIYVQDRLREHAEQVFTWLQQGAHLYICGDATRMAKDVHQALVEIVAEQGDLNVTQAESYLKSLRTTKRYQKDVY